MNGVNKSGVKGRMLECLAFMTVVVMLAAMLSGCDLSSFVNNSQKRIVSPSGTVASSEYKSVFEGTGIVHSVGVVGENTVSYAMSDSDGFIYCQDYAYSGDSVTEWEITDYIPIYGFTAESLKEMEKACDEDLSAYDGYDCVQASYSVGNKYITFRVKFTGIGKESTMKQMVEMGFLDDYDGYLSMEDCEKMDLQDGYIKK